MGSNLRINIPGEEDFNIVLINKIIAGEMTREQAKNEMNNNKNQISLGTYQFISEFLEAMKTLTKEKQTMSIQKVIEILEKANELVLSYQEGLIFLQGLNEIENLGISVIDSKFQNLFKEIKQLVLRYINMKNKKATLEFS